MKLCELTLSQWKDIATITGIVIAFIGMVIALVTYFTNVCSLRQNRRIENLKSYFSVHDKLFKENGFIMSNIKELEDGTYIRDQTNFDAELKINIFLGDVEEIAILTSQKAVSQDVQVYMFGWFAQKIQPHLIGSERTHIFWELAIHYIDELKKAADDYEKLSTSARAKYLKKNTLTYRMYS